MVDIETNFSTQVAFAVNPSYTMTETENGIIKDVTGPRSTTHGHARQATNQTGRTDIRTSIVIHSIDSGFLQIRVSFRVHAITVLTKFIDVSSLGTHSISASWNLVGTPKAEYSYLEQLYKLDNYSKAQYIPSNLR